MDQLARDLDQLHLQEQESILPILPADLAPLPLPSDIQLLSDFDEIDRVFRAWSLTDSIVVGLDTEWTASFKKGVPPGRTSILQIAYSETIYLIQLHPEWPALPKGLLQFLNSNQVLKVGNRVWSSDCKKLNKDWGCAIAESSCIPLNHVCKKQGWCSSAQISLAKMCEIVLKYSLPKEKKTRLSKWGETLSFDQKEYAARDAWASLKIYQAVQQGDGPL